MKHKISLVCILGALLLSFNSTAFAATDTGMKSSVVMNAAKLTNETEARVMGTPRGRLLSSASVRITDEGNGTIGIYSDMLCHVPLRKMLLWLYLEQWDSSAGDWNTVDYQHFEWNKEDYPDEDLTMAMVSYSVPHLERGQDYRVRGMFGAYEIGTNYQETWMAETANLFIE